MKTQISKASHGLAKYPYSPNVQDEPLGPEGRVGTGGLFGFLDSRSKCDIYDGCPIHNYTLRKGIPSP